jgi:hypothetical protein
METVEKYNLGEPGAYEIIHSKGVDKLPPKIFNVSGSINAPLSYCQSRISQIDENISLLTYSVEDKKIVFYENPNDHFGNVITGALKFHKDMESWGINKSTQFTTFELSDKIKLNRHKFDSLEVAMKLVTELKNFKARVEKEIESSTNNRGTVRQAVDQVFTGNIPEKFDINLHVFTGIRQPVKFQVEIYINPNTFSCSLISPDLDAYIEQHTERLVLDTVAQIENILPELPVLEL